MYPVLCPRCAGRNPVCPECLGRGLVLASNVTGMGELGSFSSSIKKVAKKIKKQIKRSTKDVAKVAKQIPHAPVKLAKQTATQIKEHKKELVGIASVAAAPLLIASGVGVPVALAVTGAGVGAATKPGEGFGKPKTWLTRAGAGGAAGFATGALLPTAWGGYGGAQIIGSGIAKGASATGSAVKGLFTPAPAAAAPATGAAATGMEIAPAAVSPLVASAAPAAAGGGFSWGGLFSAVGAGLTTAAQILGGKGAALSVAPGATPGIQIDASQGGAGLTPSEYYGTDYGGGVSDGSGGGGSSAPTQYVSDEGEEITPPGAELLEKAMAGKLTPKEWAVYGAMAAGVALLGYGLYKRSRRRPATGGL